MDREGHPALGSHLSTTVLWHSLAYGEQATGLTRAEMNAALGHPDVSFDNYDSALEALAGGDMHVACYYLYDEERVRFKSDPNLIRIIDQRVDNTPDAHKQETGSSHGLRTQRSALVASRLSSSRNHLPISPISCLNRSSQ